MRKLKYSITNEQMDNANPRVALRLKNCKSSLPGMIKDALEISAVFVPFKLND